MNGPETSIDVDAEITALSKLSPVEYERLRKDAAKKLAVGQTFLDDEVRTRRKSDQSSAQGQQIKLIQHEAWSEAVEGTLLLDAIAGLIRRHVVLNDSEARAIALWVLASHTFASFFIFPRLLIKSPEKGCGKSTLLDLIGCLVNQPFIASHATASPLFRLIAKCQPTILLDEADAYLRHNEEARAIINAGHKKGALVMRSVGDEHEPRGFSVYAPMVIAGIGNQAETVEDRSIIIELKRKKVDERAESFRADRPGEADVLARKCARWVQDNTFNIDSNDPIIPEGLYNRAADNWRPLFAVADAVDGPWPEQARLIAVSMIKGEFSGNASLSIQLLQDIRAVSEERRGSPIWSSDLATALRGLPDRPWADYEKGCGLNPNALARLLGPFGIQPKQIRIGDKNQRGYRVEQFADAFERYLSPSTGSEIATTLQQPEIRGLPENHTATAISNVAGDNLAKPLVPLDCSNVAASHPPADGIGTANTAAIAIPHDSKAEDSPCAE